MECYTQTNIFVTFLFLNHVHGVISERNLQQHRWMYWDLHGHCPLQMLARGPPSVLPKIEQHAARVPCRVVPARYRAQAALPCSSGSHHGQCARKNVKICFNKHKN